MSLVVAQPWYEASVMVNSQGCDRLCDIPNTVAARGGWENDTPQNKLCVTHGDPTSKQRDYDYYPRCT